MTVVLCDVMDTLVHEPFHVEMPQFFGMTLEELIREKHPTAWVEFELGRWTEEEFLARFFGDGRAFDHGAFKRRIAESYRWLPGMEALIGEVAARGVEVHALSNYPEWFNVIEARLGLGRFLRWSFVSCRTGVRKPDARAFTGAAAALGRVPSECLVIDDRETNCAAARVLGMDALRFTSARELRVELARRGLVASR